MRKKIFIILCLVLFGIVAYVTSPFANSSKVLPQEVKKRYTSVDVPELSEILSSDQEKRLKAGRRLVERVDVEKALEILENSDMPHTGEGHLVVHQIGFFAYNKYGLDSILKCKDYFLYACYHGAIIEAASNQGFGEIAKMTDRCKEYAKRYFQCVHAAGHAINAIWDYALDEALKTCDELYEREAQFPDAVTSCHNGAFMENLFGVHDWGTGKEVKREWLSGDMFFPCNAFSEKYQKGCWLNQAARIYQKYNGDIIKTARTCEMIGNSQYTVWCIDNLARQIHPLTNGDVNQVFRMCSQLGDQWRENCIIVNAGSFYSVGDPNRAITICQMIILGAQPKCFSDVIAQISTDNSSSSDKRKLCAKIGGVFESQCLWQSQI